MVGIIPYAGLDIAAFELMRDELHKRYDRNPPPQHLLVAGMLSSTGAQLVAYPLGLRLQVNCLAWKLKNPEPRCRPVRPTKEDYQSS